MGFADRRDAGRRLAALLTSECGAGTVVLGLPRGGVPVAAEVAAALGAPLDVLVARKTADPRDPELAIGAVAEDGMRVLDAALVRRLRLTPDAVAADERAALAEVRRRVDRYRPGRPALDLAGRTAVLVDDGLATGATALVACRAARAAGAARVVLAVPVAPPGWTRRFSAEADALVAALTPPALGAVGAHYADFRQVADAEVLAALAGAGGVAGPMVGGADA